MKTLGTQRLQIANLRFRFEIQLFLGGNLFSWRNQNHIPVLAHIKTTLLHDDIQRLIPWNIFQDQRNGALNRIADHHIHSGELADHLQ